MKCMEPVIGSTGTDIFVPIAGERMPMAWIGLLSWIIPLVERSVGRLRKTAPTFSFLSKATVVRSSILVAPTVLFHFLSSSPVIFPEYWILPLPVIPILERSLERMRWAGTLSMDSSMILRPRDSFLTALGFVIPFPEISYRQTNLVPLAKISCNLRIFPIPLSRHSKGTSLA